MAQDPNLTTEGTGDQVAVHVNDYARFTRLLKWTAIIVAILVLILLMIIK